MSPSPVSLDPVRIVHRVSAGMHNRTSLAATSQPSTPSPRQRTAGLSSLPLHLLLPVRRNWRALRSFLHVGLALFLFRARVRDGAVAGPSSSSAAPHPYFNTLKAACLAMLILGVKVWGLSR